MCVFAPVGLALTAVEDLPALATKGRERVELELSNARVVGRYMVSHARRELAGRLGTARQRPAPSADESDAPVDTHSTAPGHRPSGARPGGS